MEDSPSAPYAVSSPSLSEQKIRARATSVPNFSNLLKHFAPEAAAAATFSQKQNNQNLKENVFKNSAKYFRLATQLKEGQKLLSIAKTHGIQLADENEKLRFENSKIQIEYSNLLFQFTEEEKKCQYRDELINDLYRDKEDLTVALEQLQIKVKSQREAQEEDVTTLNHQAQSLQDLRTCVELMHAENSNLRKEVQLLIAKGKKDAELIAEHKSKSHEMERANKHSLAKLRHLEERHENFSVVAQKLREARAKLENLVLERDMYSREVENLRSKIETKTLEGLSHLKQSQNDNSRITPMAKLCTTPSPRVLSINARSPDKTKPPSLLTLLQHHSDCRSVESEQGVREQIINEDHDRQTTLMNSSTLQHNTTNDSGQLVTNALSEYLYMTASAIKIKFRDVPVSQDILAKAGQSVPFWKAYDLMHQYAMEAETKQVLNEVNRYQEENQNIDEQEWDSDEDDYKIQNNVPIYHWSVLTNPQSFFTRLSTEIVDRLAPSTLFPNVTRFSTEVADILTPTTLFPNINKLKPWVSLIHNVS